MQTKITDAGLKHLAGLPKLEILNLQGTQVSDDGLKALESMKQLKVLDVSKTKISEAGAGQLKKVLTKTQILR
jgi:Leucine-rich repeat (LRR) protein